VGKYRHLGFLKFQIFNGQFAQDGETASLCQILNACCEKFVKIG